MAGIGSGLAGVVYGCARSKNAIGVVEEMSRAKSYVSSVTVS